MYSREEFPVSQILHSNICNVTQEVIQLFVRCGCVDAMSIMACVTVTRIKKHTPLCVACSDPWLALHSVNYCLIHVIIFFECEPYL